MKDSGLHETPDGLLPLAEIKKAGYKLDEFGKWAIPAEEYISDGNHESRKAGEKFWGVSSRYVTWKNAKIFREMNPDIKPKERQLKLEIKEEEVGVPTTDDGVDISMIPF